MGACFLRQTLGTLIPCLSQAYMLSVEYHESGSLLVIQVLQSYEELSGNRVGSGCKFSKQSAGEFISPKVSQILELVLAHFK